MRTVWLRAAITALAVAIAISAWLMLKELKYGFSLWDEGFLWYGSQRVLRGEVPIRDFLSYDIGRYYLSALIMSLRGSDGILAQRDAALVCGLYSLGLGVWLVYTGAVCKSTAERCLRAAAASVLFFLWMVPRHKWFDIAASLSLLAVLAAVIAQATPKRFFAAGIVVGLCAVMGRNHGVYGVVAFLLAFAYLAFSVQNFRLKECFLAWMAGIVIGFMPVLGFAIFVDGFAVSMWEGIRWMLFEYKGTNLPLPVPWPWLMLGHGGARVFDAQVFGVGLLFVSFLIFDVLGILLLALQMRRRTPSLTPVFAAAVLLAIPYTHFAFSRADVSHLAQAIFPLTVGLLAAPIGKRLASYVCNIAFVATSLVAALPQHPLYVAELRRDWVPLDVAGDTLMVDPATATEASGIVSIVRRYAPHDQRIFAAPYWPGLYAMLHMASPVWEIYATVPRNSAFQRAEIERLKKANPRLVLILDMPLDRREDLRYSNTHRELSAFVQQNFRCVPSEVPIPGLSVYVK